MFEFAWWWALFLLPLPFLFRLLPAKTTGQSVALKVPFITGQYSSQGKPVQKNITRWILATLSWICLVIAAAQPQWLGEPVSVQADGRDLMVAVDLSGSMKIDDMELNGQRVNRLRMIKSVLGNFIGRRVGDRIGLILFADTAYLQTPLTYDRETVLKLLDEAVIGLVGEQTAIGDAIGLAAKRFEEKENSNKVLILLTDGQNTAGNISPQQAQELAISRGITIYTIGVGADEMIVRSFFGSRQVNPSSELDEEMLQDLAQSTNGQYFRARDAEALREIYLKLDELEPIERESLQLRPLTSLYFYPLALGLALSVLMLIPTLVIQFGAKRRA